MDMDPEYRRNHYRMPHEQLISRTIPGKLDKPGQPNTTIHTILWVIMAFGLVVMVLLGIAMWRDCRRKKRQDLMDAQERVDNTEIREKGEKSTMFHNQGRNLYPNPEIEEKGSLFDGSIVTTTTSEIQPKAPPFSHEKIDEMSRKSSFGMVNIHRQQSGRASSSTDFSSSHLPSTTTTNASSSGSLSGLGKRVSRLESFPYEEYGIPEGERHPIKTRVQDLKTYDHFLHLTRVDSDLLEEDNNSDEGSGQEEGRHGEFENHPTLPRNSSH